jgi:hypothetical protein
MKFRADSALANAEKTPPIPLMMRPILALTFLAVLSGCAETPARNVASVPAHHRAAQYGTTSTIVDYAGLPCGDQHLMVQSPVCLFPHVEGVPSRTHITSETSGAN